MERWLFPIRKGGIFRHGKEIEGLRGGVHGYRLAERRDPACATAEGSGQLGRRSHRPKAEKDPFRMETRTGYNYLVVWQSEMAMGLVEQLTQFSNR